jgi:hypothetical protein
MSVVVIKSNTTAPSGINPAALALVRTCALAGLAAFMKLLIINGGVSGFWGSSCSLVSFLGLEFLGFPVVFFFSSDELPEAFESLAERRPGGF